MLIFLVEVCGEVMPVSVSVNYSKFDQILWIYAVK